MADSNYTIEVKGAGSAGGASQSANLDTSDFQKSLKDLTKGIQNAATSANRFVTNMQKIEAQLSATLKSGFSPGKNDNVNQGPSAKADSKKADSGMDSKNTEKFVKNISSLTDAIDKLTSGIKDNFKPKEKPEEKQETRKDNLISDTKKLLAAVGIGAIAKQIAENEIINPARATGMLIGSNVVSNPTQAGSSLLASYQNRVANDTGSIFGVAGGVAGAALGSIIPGLGTFGGGALGYGAGKLIGDTIGQNNMATELPTLQRALSTDYYSSLSKQVTQFGRFSESQYGPHGFLSSNAQEPYFESKAELGRGFSRFAGGNLGAGTATGILGSLAAQGASSPQEVNLTGNLLGQIARYTGKSSVDIEKVYKSVEKSGMTPNEGLQKALSLLQSGQSVKETTDILQRTSQRGEAFGAGQQNYLSGTPFQQYSAQLAGNVTGVDTEKFFQGDSGEIAKARKIFKGAAAARRKGISGFNQDSIFATMLMANQGIQPSMADNNLKVPHSLSNEFLKPGDAANDVMNQTQKAITEGARGRSSREIIDEALSEIGKSTNAFTGLSGATNNLTSSFETAAKSFMDLANMRNTHPDSPLVWKSDKKILSQAKDGR